ncbi:MAG: DUF1592 domain-containing protein [Planctomycetales bacterium]
MTSQRPQLAILVLMTAVGAHAAEPEEGALDRDFTSLVRPFLHTYCLNCHGEKKQDAKLSLAGFDALGDVIAHHDLWETVLQRLEAEEMPPAKAPRHPSQDERRRVVLWIQTMRDDEARRNAGDPGPVLARRLSNAEYDYTIRDLTGVDIRPNREFPVDPANSAGFDNSGESLAVSPALVKKYLAAARFVADHLVLKPDRIVFAPAPVVSDTDRDQYCVQQIIAFYQRQRIDLADYFFVAWRYRHRAALGLPEATFPELAASFNESRSSKSGQRGKDSKPLVAAPLSAKYLNTLWALLTDPTQGAPIAPLSEVREFWRNLPNDPRDEESARRGGVELRDLVQRRRAELSVPVPKLHVDGISDGSQPLVLWRNRQLAERRMRYLGEVSGPERESLERFCRVFPDAFFIADRGPYFDPQAAGQGRLLTAGFHLMQGYFRDDAPLRELILEEEGQRALDRLWDELNFVTGVPMRQYKDFIFFERAEPPRFMQEAKFDFARSEDKDAISPQRMQQLQELYVAKARQIGASDQALEAMQTYFEEFSAEIRRVERARLAAEPRHLEGLVEFARRAFRRPLTDQERDDLLAGYRRLREAEELGHEEALRDSLAGVLMSPHFLFLAHPAVSGPTAVPLSDIQLASRLSYFLWSSLPDDELLRHAAAGDLHQPEVLTAQARRMLRDERIRALAAEFAGNWLDVRRFEEHNAVDRERFPEFTAELRQAMWEEPLRFFMDVAAENRSVLDFLYARHTFVNPLLAKHYGIPYPEDSVDEWIRVNDAEPFGRGGLLPMSVFLTKNAPGLRTSPVKRGYWVVRRLLGEQIPPPPPEVPELPKDEAQLGALSLPQLLARHREHPNCAGCHVRFDAVGLAFEGYGPIGERRELDLGGRPVENTSQFPDGSTRTGLAGLQHYLRDQRQEDFLRTLCSKLLAYALGRTLQLSDRSTLEQIRARLSANEYRFETLIESIITSPQFLNRRSGE